MGKVLYITMLNDNAKNGGFVYRKAIGSTLSMIVGESDIDIVTSELDDSEWSGNIVYRVQHYASKRDKFVNILGGNITQIGKKDEKMINELIYKNQYKTVVFGCSETGHLIKSVKKNGVKTITLYNDIIADAVKHKWQLERKISYLLVALFEMGAEKKSIQFSDVKIALNERDSDLMNAYWKQKADVLIPICLEDSYVYKKEYDNVEGQLRLLFVGSYGWTANTEGIIWFCKNVMKKLDKSIATLYIAGYEMEKIAEYQYISELENVIVLGTVDNLNDTYAEADVVVAPILTGTGMKTKTAEALMHGKTLLASPEALEGFIGLSQALCECQVDYINKIKYFNSNRPKRFNKEYRNLFEEHYSVDAMRKGLEKLV